MAMLHACRFVVASILVTFFLPSRLQASTLRKLSFQLPLQRPPLNLHNATCMQQPLTPYLISDQPLFHYDESSLTQIHAGHAHGLYLADPAAAMELCYVFFTATLQKYEGGQIARAEAAAKHDKGGSLVLMGSIGSGAVSVVGGTGSFSFASGHAKVSVAPGGSAEQLIIFFDVELESEEEIALS